jgi:menaquinone-dependent protoporphyrinogen oxidase
MRILIAYGSTHGQTERIAAQIATRLREEGAEVVLTKWPARMRAMDFDAILVGARDHGSRYPWRVTRFIRNNLDLLRERPSAFFSVSLLQLARDPEARRRTQELPARAAATLGWTPSLIAVFGGALRWRQQYGIFAPFAKWMWRRTLGTQLDASRDEQIFTDWDEVDLFAHSFLKLAKSKRAGSTTNARPRSDGRARHAETTQA